ncbi:MAG TPA: protein kinase [Anaerolineales bacterium]|nr:protein kinase [Anaerolineales bacterium]
MDQPTWIGRTLSGRYKIDALLGQGGMSAVYKATDPNLKRVVAIKLIHSHLSSDSMFVLRFESEASAVASLRHPNIVQVYDFNTDNGVYYMVLEFIPGETLQERLKRLNDAGRKLPLEDTLKLTGNISDAMGYAHQRGMVHRDIKPANIMLDVHGQAILMDFGIVKILGGDSHTSTGAVVGTARYMSPETIRGEVADHRSDIYSLGVTLFEMLSGRPPFVADSAMTLMMMHLNDPVPNIREFRADIHPELIRILEKSLAKERADRYQSAAEMSADLRHALGTVGTQPTTIPTPEIPKSDSRTQTEMVPTMLMDDAPRPVDTVTESIEPPAISKPPSSRRFVWGIGAALIGILCLAALLAGNRLVSGMMTLAGDNTPSVTVENIVTPTTEATQEENAAVLITETVAPTQTVTEEPTEAPTATETMPPLYVRINSITVNDAAEYVVEYETFGYTETLPGMHVHFFFDTVPPERAGSPASGPWFLYGGPRPFTKYREIDRPADATQMCALVANSNHTVIQGSGNCMNLP